MNWFPAAGIFESIRNWRARARTPAVFQMEATECGAAALGIILGYYGLWVTLEELRIACGVSRDGASAANIVRAARTYGLIARGFRKELVELQALVFPVVVFWEFRHFVVVEGFSRRKVYINDPDTGPRTVSLEEFDKAFTGIVLEFRKGSDFQKNGKRRTLLQGMMERLPDSWAGHVYVLAITLALTLLSITIPILTKVFIDGFSSSNGIWLQTVLVGMTIAIIFRGVLTYWQQSALLRLQVKLAVQSSASFFWHLVRLPIEFFTQRMAGEISNRVEINDRIADLLSRDLATQFINILLIGFFLAFMMQYEFRLALLILLIASINGLAHYRMSRLRLDANRKILQERGKLIGISVNGLQSIETLKANGAEGEFFARWSGQYTDVLNAEQDLAAKTLYLPALSVFLTTAATIAVLVAGGLNVIGGFMTVGVLIAFQGLSSSFMEPVARLVDQGDRLQQVHADLNRLDDVLSHPIDPGLRSDNRFRAGDPSLKLSGHLELRNVTFGYSRTAKPVIRDINFKLLPGRRIAIVGRSGSGKSTLAKLCCGLYQPWSGEILLDGQPLNQFDRTILNRVISMVDQDIFLFGGTLGENLTMWDESVPRYSIERAVDDACIDFEMSHSPGKYDVEIQEGGANLSGGQRQRLEIARALISNPSILILDEATSALDPHMESIVSSHIRKRGCACLILAHRLSTIRECDQIIVLEDGVVAQSGTHEELVGLEGPYSRLIKTD
ncbi:MAG: NHLP family bacteriocin export ABC transporter peptidase/permease/ATPase subunit [Candidatus Angelobacter sp.]